MPMIRRAPMRFFTGLAVAIATLLLALPAEAKRSAEQIARQVDRLLAEELFTDATQLAPRTNDATFLRRAWLDLAGDIPSPEQVKAFRQDSADDKRDRAVDELLADPRFGQNWARYWRDVILYRRLEDRAMIVSQPLIALLTDEFNRNVPWNEIAAQFVIATGDIRENGPTAIVAAQEGRTEEVAAETARIFLGMQIQCAQCHDHPYDRWKREQFHELAAFFPRIGFHGVNMPPRRTFEVVSNDRPEPRRRISPEAEVRRGTAEHYMPDLDDPAARGTRMQPKFFLTGAELAFGTPDATRRGTVAQWITASPWFATAYVNRIWAELVGEGFYEPVDDLGPDRTPSAPKAVALLSREFAEASYDVKWLFRTICSTQAYQRQCRPRRDASDTPFAANVAQPLRGDQLFNAVLTALDVEETSLLLGSAARIQAAGRQPSPRQMFAVVFGYDPSDPRDTVTTSVAQSLAMMNTRQLNRAIARPDRDGLISRLVSNSENDESLVVELYLRTLSREPSEEELNKVVAYRQSMPRRQVAFEDLLWVLLNSSEFSHRR